MNRIAQVSMEYLTVFGFALLLTVPLLLIYSLQTKNMQDEVLTAQVYSILTKITDSAEEIYYEGPPAKKTIRIAFPEGINAITVNDSYIEASYSSGKTEIFISKDTTATLNGTIRHFSGEHVITFTATANEVELEDK